MKKVNDSKLYFYAGIVAAIIAVILVLTSGYSIFFVEPEVEALLQQKETASESYKKAYFILREPQIFAGYEHFDRAGGSVKEIMRYYDRRLVDGEEFAASDARYLSILLDRRQKGSDLGAKSAVFILLISLMTWTALLIEKKRNI